MLLYSKSNYLFIIAQQNQLFSSYYALELCDASLDQLFLKDGISEDLEKYKGPIPTQEQVVFQLARGLIFIHNNDIVHRDIKPENVLIVSSPNGPILKWADFGLSRTVNLNGSYTMSGVKGTRKWMAPELLELDDEDSKLQNEHRGTILSDVFSAGCLFFYCLTRGTHPFGSRSSDIVDNIKHLKATNIGGNCVQICFLIYHK